MSSRKAIIDRIRSVYETYTLSRVIGMHNFFLESCPSQGEMTDEDYKKMLIENVLEWRLKICDGDLN